MIATIEFLRDHFDLLFRVVALLRNPALIVGTAGVFAALAYAVSEVRT